MLFRADYPAENRLQFPPPAPHLLNGLFPITGSSAGPCRPPDAGSAASLPGRCLSSGSLSFSAVRELRRRITERPRETASYPEER